jgi:hypothetical protein
MKRISAITAQRSDLSHRSDLTSLFPTFAAMHVRPIQMIGTQRSGSNLLRLMLNQSEEVVAPHPPHILEVFFPLLDRYGDLNRPPAFRLLIEDVRRLIETNPVPWPIMLPDEPEIFRRCRERSLPEVFNQMYAALARETGARTWCCKSMANVYYIREIEAAGIEPLYLHLVRDGRDAAVSFRKALVGEKHPWHLARQWVTDQAAALAWQQRLPKERYFRVHYEALILQPEETLRDLCARAGIRYRPGKMLEYYRSPESARTAAAGDMWANLDKPLLTENRGKYREEMSSEELLIFESVAGEMLEQLGYVPEFAVRERIRNFSEEEIADFDRANEARKAQVRANARPADLTARAEREALIREIKSR